LRKTAFLGTEPIGSLLLRLSLPAMVGMLVQASYNIVDAFFIGWGVGPMGLAGTAVAFPLHFFVMGLATMGGVGAASLVSRSLGAGDVERADRALGTLVTLALATGLSAAFLGRAFLPQLLALLGASGEILPPARTYIAIILLGIPFHVLGVGLNNVVRAEGNARVAMFTMLISAGANTVLDPLFIFGFGWGIAGAAWATVISQALVVVWLGNYVFSGRSALKLKAGHLVPREAIVRQIVSVGASEFARLTASGFTATVVVHSMGRFGSPLAVAAYGVISRVLSVFFMPMMGISQGLQPVLGYNYGAGLWGRAHRAVRLSAAAASAISALGFLVLLLFPGQIFGIFTADPELRAIGARSLRTMTLGFAFIGFQTIGSTLFQALGKGAPALFLSMSRQVLFFLPLILVLPRLLGLVGVWLAFPAADVLSALVTFGFFSRQIKELRELETAPPGEGPRA
jgi:putative MATE family efflux protein